MNKSTLVFVIIAAIGALIIGLFLNINLSPDESFSTEEKVAAVTFDSEVEQVLARQMAQLTPLLTDGAIVQAVSASNERNRNLQLEQILKLDRQWLSAESAIARAISESSASRKLVAFQEDHPGFSEIFVTDSVGLNVAQTNKTSDFYQADESWWIQTYNNGVGLAHHGLVEFDESARAEAISLYVPLYDSGTSKVIGVLKAVLSIAAIKIEL
ncbi:hypothetical protein HYW60_01155 [Candidatus Kaiserbacteria bacterium]|nr:hypothetical protein [Candidatus Kaiserbacteria bacterium]